MPAFAARLFRSGLAVGMSLAPVLVQPSAVGAESNALNPDIERMCEGLAMINNEFGATAAPGSPMGQRMQQELSVSAAQYGALWSLMKLTPTKTCKALY